MSVQFICWETASDKVYQLLGHGRWFSPDTSASSTTKTGRHDIAETLLKVALSTINQIKSFAGNNQVLIPHFTVMKELKFMVMPHVPQNLALIQYNISSILFSSYRNNV